MNLTVPPSMRGAARVITDSEGSRADILRVYGYAPEHVVAIPLAVSSEFARALNEDPNRQERAQHIAKEKYNIGLPYLLAVGVLQPRKNLPLLAEAFGRAKSAHHLPHQLVLVGKMGWGAGREVLEAALKRGGADGNALHITGYVEDKDLPYLYHACEAFAHPALYEGFGLTPLEAMACGAPVLVSDATPMPEVVGEAARILSARSVEAWAEAIGAVLQDADLRQSLRERGRERVTRFSWQETARRTLEVYRAVAQAAPS
jgi:glycosyltransferase involved in cell wall biosynthesis